MAGGEAGATIITKVVKDLLGDAAEAVERDVARDAASTAAKDAARDAAQTAGRDAAKDSAESGARDAAEQAAEDAARRGGREAAEDAGTDTATKVGERTTTKDPVDVASGEVVLHEVDVALPGVLPLELNRTHISSYRSGRWFGRSWSSTLDQRLEVDALGACLVGAEGLVLVYPIPMFGEPVMPERGPRWPLTYGQDGYTVADPGQGRTLHFAPQPGADIPGSRAMVLPLKAIVDRVGNRIDLDYDSDGTLVEIRHSGGYRIGVTTAGGRITELRLLNAADRPVLARYEYGDAGRLTEVSSPGSAQPTTFEYDNAGRLTRWADAIGGWYAYTYDDQGRCVRGEGPDGRLATSLDYRGRLVVVTDSLGHQTTYQLDERGKVTAETNPLGATTWSEWDHFGQPVSRTDPLGRAVRFSYDEHGNLTGALRPDGTRSTVGYNELHLPVELTEPDGAVWRQRFDLQGNLVSITDPAGAVTAYGYDERGHLAWVRDPFGAVTRLETNAAGLPVAMTNPKGGVTRYERDAHGRVVAVTDPLGSTTRCGWTGHGRPAWRTYPGTNPDGEATETWTHDAVGNLVAYTDPLGQTTRVEIGAFDVPVAQTGPDGARLEFGYDSELRLVTVTNPQGLVWRYAYDAAGNLVGETDFNGRHVSYRHDQSGQLTARANGVGQAVEYVRDAVGRVVEKRSAEQVTRYGYDAAGRLVGAVNAAAELRFERDPLGRIVAEICNGRRLESRFDAAGRRVGRRTPSGAQSTWTYDAAGLPATLTTGGQIIGFDHDPAGREVQRRLGAGAVLAQEWDPAGRLTGQALWGAPAVAGQEVASGPAQPRLLQHRAYAYRGDGQVSAIADRLTGDRRFGLDAVGRVTAVEARGWTERYAYDAAGNLSQATRPASADVGGDLAYDGTLVRRAGRVRYEHDAQGRVVLRQRARPSAGPATWRYHWDADDHLVGVETPDGGRWRYLYDPLGRRIAKELLGADGRVVERFDFAWDGPLIAEQAHSAWSAPQQAWVTTGTAWDYEPGTFRPVSQTIRAPLRDAPQQWIDQRFHAIVTDLVGTPAELVDTAGNIAWAERTTLWGAPMAAPRGTVGCPLRFPGQYHDDETGFNYNYHRYYDPGTARYATGDPLGLAAAPNPQTYVANPLRWLDPLGLCPERGVTYFDERSAGFYKGPNATLGPPGGTVWFMSEADSALVHNTGDAARYSGMAPTVQNAYVSGQPVYGVNFPTAGLDVRTPTAADAGGWPHFLEGGHTAVRLEGDNGGYLVNPVREYVTPGGNPVPEGSVLFRLGPNGEQIPVRRF